MRRGQSGGEGIQNTQIELRHTPGMQIPHYWLVLLILVVSVLLIRFAAGGNANERGRQGQSLATRSCHALARRCIEARAPLRPIFQDHESTWVTPPATA